MRILIVDDDAASLKVLSLFMKPFGKVFIAKSGSEGLQSVQKAFADKNYFDIYLLDIMMPEINGHQLLAEIRKLETDSKVETPSKIIMVSALSDADNIMDAFSEKCDAYVIKPVRMEKLYEELRKLGIEKK